MFLCFSRLSDLGILYTDGGESVSNDKIDDLAAEAYERRIDKLERDNKELSRKLQGMSEIVTTR